MTTDQTAAGLDRRQAFQMLASLGVGSLVFQRSLAAQAEGATAVTVEMIQQAEWISGLKLAEADVKALVRGINGMIRGFVEARKIAVPNSVAPAVAFNPAPWLPPAEPQPKTAIEPIPAPVAPKPAADEDVAFLPLTALAGLVRTRQISSVELTKLYLDRLHKYDPVLRCVVTFTDDLALKQAAEADREIAAGRYRGPLHGIPYGAKDLIAVPGYKTTWGAKPFREQTIDTKATVIKKLEEAGAVLVAKTTLGALAMGDQWFGGMTRNPWNPKQGSSGSSAGSTSAVVAGLVGFAIGSETLGSIVSPCTQCGATGLRPTFGRVSRHGCMTLSWSMDKLGPIARSVEDCALVFGAIHGFDGLDASAVDRPFHWPARRDLKSLKVGLIDGQNTEKQQAVLKDLGVDLVPIKLPEKYQSAMGAMRQILGVEAAAAFDDITRQGVTDGLNSWPQTFRQGQFVPAVEYLRANRLRSLLMQEMNELMAKVDLYVGVGGADLVITNLTGHPSVVMRIDERVPGSGRMIPPFTFTGRLFGESELLSLSRAYQEATGFHKQHPPMDKVTAENAG